MLARRLSCEMKIYFKLSYVLHFSTGTQHFLVNSHITVREPLNICHRHATEGLTLSTSKLSLETDKDVSISAWKIDLELPNVLGQVNHSG